MANCKNCGAKTGSGLTVLWVLLGTAAVAIIGLPLLVIVALTAVAAIGTSANDQFNEVSSQLDAPATAEYTMHGALDHVPAEDFHPTDAHGESDDFTAAQ